MKDTNLNTWERNQVLINIDVKHHFEKVLFVRYACRVSSKLYTITHIPSMCMIDRQRR